MAHGGETQEQLDGPVVVAAAVVARRRWKVVEALNETVLSGGTAVLVVADADPDAAADPEIAPLDPRVRVLDLVAEERRLAANRLLPGGVWPRVRENKVYRLGRPWLLWRALRPYLDRSPADGGLDVSVVDHVIVVGQESWPIAWQLARLNPRITVGWEVPDEVFERYGRTPVRVVSTHPA